MNSSHTDLSARTNTLTSLSILKVDIDEGSRDYMDYLGAFVTEGLALKRPEVVSDSKVVDILHAEFGLRIPIKAVQHVLRRLAKQNGHLSLKDGAYFLGNDFPEPTMSTRRAEAKQQIDSVIERLCKYSADVGVEPAWSMEQSSSAVMSFLGQFAIDCLRTHVFNTALPNVPPAGAREHYVVGRFISDAHQSDPALFEAFIVLVKGQMYANALTCPDLQSLQQKFGTLTCYLDTPVVLNLLGLHGTAFHAAALELVELVRDLSGSVAMFQHTFEETLGVLRFSIAHFDDVSVTNRTLRELRASKRHKSDLIVLAGDLEARLAELHVRVVDTPRYTEKFQIDEQAFGDALLDEIHYIGAQALANDVNSIRSIYVRRQGTLPARLEDARAVLVTSNTAFAKAAYFEGRDHNSSREVSPVVTDYSLANVAWLKAPLKRPTMPERETLALCYAGLEPSGALVEKYVRTMDEMLKSGRISPNDHALLRASSIAESELMGLTLGDDDALTEQSISQILATARSALVADLTQVHEDALRQRDAKQSELESELTAHQRVRARINRRAHGIARMVFRAIFAFLSATLLVGAFTGAGLMPARLAASDSTWKLVIQAVTVVAVVWGWWNLLNGKSIATLLKRPEDKFAQFLVGLFWPDRD